jgi:hypothetical protein
MFVAIGNGARATDQFDLSIRCPKCGQIGIFHGYHNLNDLAWAVPQNGQPRVAIIGMRICPNAECRAFVFVEAYDGKLIKCYPPETIDFDPTKVPQNIAASLREAILCHASGCYRAAALMIRRTLEEMCEERGAQGKNLNDRIEALKSSVTVSKELFEAAHELRLLGNDAAHIFAKTYDGIESEETEVGIELAKELLKAVYQQSNLVDKLKALKKPATP